MLERAAFHEAVAQAEFADQLGYHEVWAVEHHGLSEYSHCSAPEILLAYIAARTKRVRLGHAVTLTPHRYNHPIRIAERIAMLDILSEGRVDWGSGKSSTLVEQGAFQIERNDLEGQWREAIQMIPRMWRSDYFEWNSQYYQIPPTAIIPKPVQKPHPPIFAACSRPESVELAGSLGIGSLNFTAGTDSYLSSKVQSYRAAISKARGPGGKVNNRFCCTPVTLVLTDDRRACEYGFRGARFFQESFTTYFFSRERIEQPIELSRGPLSLNDLEKVMASRNGPDAQLTNIVGDPVAAIESVGRFKAAGVDELILVMALGTVPHTVVMESMKIFAEKVMPCFA
jgi:alkanesulfonate monooxygenase SsuD/methylene tetrahydromethanopterin reductase-like flavin-dependent oxidoreductase (luciferase family)